MHFSFFEDTFQAKKIERLFKHKNNIIHVLHILCYDA